MKLRSIRLHPFAGIEDASFDFEEGLTVLLGPNEAGKSTVFNAVMHGLLTTTSLTRTKVGDIMGPYFPKSGGDVIRTTLVFENEDSNEIRVQKTWKEGTRNGNASLKIEGSGEITDEDTVQQRIDTMLPVSPATLRTIMFADQSSLHQTLNEMEGAGEVRKELGSILRKNFMETGGISVDRFRDKLDYEYEEFFNRWDRGQQYPENNRGIKNPYKVGTGKVVEAFYQKEGLRIDLEEARSFENKLDELNERLTSLLNEQREKSERFSGLKPLREGIQQRQVKEEKLALAREKVERLLEVSKKWPVYEDRVENLAPKLEQKKEAIAELEQEQKKAQSVQKAEMLAKQIEKARQLKGKVEEARKEVDEAKNVKEEEVRALQKRSADINKLKTKIEAAKLTVKVESESPQTISYREAGGSSQRIDIGKENPLTKTPGGGFKLESDQLRVEVYSGDGDLEETVRNLGVKEEEYNELLTSLDVDSLEDAVSYYRLYESNKNALAQAKENYSAELGEGSLEDLKDELEAYGDLSDVRAGDKIMNDLVEARTEMSRLQEEAKEAREHMAAWEERYESTDKVMLEMADTRGSIRDLSAELEELPSLPEGYESADAFMREVSSLDQDIQALKEQTFEMKQEKTRLEAQAPDTSSEELERLLEDAEAEFEKIKHQAETLANVRRKAMELIENIDSDTYSGLESGFVKWLERMVGDRFTVAMDKDMPSAFETADAASLTFDVLSHGTKDTVALAWRFALCEKFLSKAGGFIILDDAMVDIDPERRKQVAEAINAFSQEYQTIYMTCHPDHAQELKEEGSVVL